MVAACQNQNRSDVASGIGYAYSLLPASNPPPTNKTCPIAPCPTSDKSQKPYPLAPWPSAPVLPFGYGSFQTNCSNLDPNEPVGTMRDDGKSALPIGQSVHLTSSAPSSRSGRGMNK